MTSGTIILTTGTDGGGSGDGNKSNEDGKGKGKHKHSGGDSGDGDEGKGEVRTLPSSLSRATASGTASNLNSKCRHGVLAVINWCAMIPTGVVMARFLKRFDPLWFYAHAAVQGLLVAIAAGFRMDMSFWYFQRSFSLCFRQK
ncbi:hypothetical protein OsJ_33649 [Oryza sativa Japonica Group]|uniref:Cytochrome b561 domain-containing protein n=1 Tax=Oryza sativa subsp. japonica TaxID=39947 RepID=B9GAC0_ORYSJ|nr:hypothetical protein OsJ_33649 [Oryza sativa Japonica Group]